MPVSYNGGIVTIPTNLKDNKGAKVPPDGSATTFVINPSLPESSINATTMAGGSFTIVGAVNATGQLCALKAGGGTMTFNVTSPDGSGEVTVTCTLPLEIARSDVLGADQLKHVRCTFACDAEEETAELRQKPPK